MSMATKPVTNTPTPAANGAQARDEQIPKVTLAIFRPEKWNAAFPNQDVTIKQLKNAGLKVDSSPFVPDDLPVMTKDQVRVVLMTPLVREAYKLPEEAVNAASVIAEYAGKLDLSADFAEAGVNS